MTNIYINLLRGKLYVKARDCYYVVSYNQLYDQDIFVPSLLLFCKIDLEIIKNRLFFENLSVWSTSRSTEVKLLGMSNASPMIFVIY